MSCARILARCPAGRRTTGVRYGRSRTDHDGLGVGMTRHGRTTLAIAGLALVMSGCSGGDEPGSGAGGTSSAPPESPSSPSSPTASGSTSEPEPTPTVELASGPTLEVGDIRVTAPARWRQVYDTPFTDVAQGRVGGGQSGGLLLGAVADDEVGLRAAMRNAFENGKKPAGFEEQDTTELGGLPAFYYTATETAFLTKHVMGLWDSGYLVHVDVSLPTDMPAEEQQEIVESIRLTYDSPGS